ncbi:lytic murein transglycosylase [Thalassorhabdomicrobium marinisediminis]|uniref:lytic murein transglycosylase n=1 Tax=Thalassorhabdomicrobium marinisediminis TaxID=2170577 RepID=UPI00249256A6|nr:lytic murein transglycosylase [Thalassorhabdomicrobium marinisediminis]
MTYSKRQFLFGFSALTLAACGASGPMVQPAQADSVPDDLRPVRTEAFSRWVANFRPRAQAAGISQATFDAAFADAGYIPGVVARDGNQIQTRRTLEEYLSIATSDERLAKGRAAMARHADTLNAIEGRYGVEARIVAAIWGMESTFGEKRGQIPVISSTATLAFDGRRGAFYESQLIAALKILERGDTTPAQLTGSWAGAMGHTQFIPTSYQSFAVDFNGDGRRDIWSDDPADALASTASYLARNGWQRGVPWGAEEGTSNLSGRRVRPQAGGVAFTVTRNFNVLKTYNNSDFYAIAVGHLSDRLAGAGPLQGSFPPDANGLTAADRIAIQQGLTARGYDIGTIDGVIGARTEAAIADFQRRQGLSVTGQATRDVLQALR